MSKVILIDMDGTLTYEVCYTEEECLCATPRKDVIARVNEIAKKYFVVIWTARVDNLIPATLRWLRINEVRFQAISNNKTPTDVGYVDDKCITIDQFLKGGI